MSVIMKIYLKLQFRVSIRNVYALGKIDEFFFSGMMKFGLLHLISFQFPFPDPISSL